MVFKLSNLSSNLALTLGYINPASNNLAQVPVVQKVDNAIHRINVCPLDSAIAFPNIYPQDSDLCGR